MPGAAEPPDGRTAAFQAAAASSLGDAPSLPHVPAVNAPPPALS